VSRYGARIRALEHKLVPGDYPLCAGCNGRGIDMITIEEGETPPPRPVCESCGKPRRAFIVEFTDEPIDTHQPERPALEPGDVGIVYHRPAPDPESITPRAESQSKPRTRRRQYSGQG